MFFLLSEGFGICDRHILEEPEGTRIADTIRSESVDRYQSADGDLMMGEGTLDIEDFFREIGDIVSSRDRLPHCLLESRDSLRLDREPCSLTMSTISDKKMLALIEELDQITPLGSSTRSYGEFFSFVHICSGIYSDCISFPTREWVIVSIFHHDTRLVVELSQATCDESDDPMIQVRCIKK